MINQANAATGYLTMASQEKKCVWSGISGALWLVRHMRMITSTLIDTKEKEPRETLAYLVL